MTVKLHIEIEGPVGPDDSDILTGTAMILMALTNKAQPPAVEGEEEEVPDEEVPPAEESMAAFVASIAAMPEPPQPCGVVEGELTCVSHVGHRGRHLLRKTASVPGMN